MDLRQEELAYFAEWGGTVWLSQLARGLTWLGDLKGLRVLDIGCRGGRMSTLFGLMGASVVGIDVTPETESDARAEAARHGVSHRVQFTTYSGQPKDLPGGFDVVFAKSVLVVVPDLDEFAFAMAATVRPGGRLLALENARGPLPIHLLRLMRRRSLRPYGARFFTGDSVATIRRHFEIGLEHWTSIPPTCLVGAFR